MKPTGIVRRVDDLGRVVIPKGIRKALLINEGDPMEIFLTDGMVSFKKYVPEKEYINGIESVLFSMNDDYDVDNRVKNSVGRLLRTAMAMLAKESETIGAVPYISTIKKGDSFEVRGALYYAAENAHTNLDEPDYPWVVYDTDGNSWFEEDFE